AGGASASYTIEVGEHKVRIHYLWEVNGLLLSLRALDFSLDETAEVVYRASERFNGQLALDYQISSPTWLLTEIPLVLDNELRLLDCDLLAATAEDRQVVIESWYRMYANSAN